MLTREGPTSKEGCRGLSAFQYLSMQGLAGYVRILLTWPAEFGESQRHFHFLPHMNEIEAT